MRNDLDKQHEPEASNAETEANFFESIIEDVCGEYRSATAAFGQLSSGHEGYGVIKEELDELWDEIKVKPQDKYRMRDEATQLAAMAIRFIVDVCSATEE